MERAGADCASCTEGRPIGPYHAVFSPTGFPSYPTQTYLYLSSCAQFGVGLLRGFWCLFLFRFRFRWQWLSSDGGVLAYLVEDGGSDAEGFSEVRRAAEKSSRCYDVVISHCDMFAFNPDLSGA